MLTEDLLSFGFKLQTKWAIARLSPEHETVTQVCGALKRIINNEIGLEEVDWFDQIETLRRCLNTNNQKITYLDYGSGRWNNFSICDMQQGHEVTSSIGAVCRSSSEFAYYLQILFAIIRTLRPTTCLELGTCLGISTSYLAAALFLNRRGRILTMEGSTTFAQIAQNNFKSLGLDNVQIVIGRFQDTLNHVLSTISPINFVFIDGHHIYQATVDYFQRILPFITDNGVIVIDDIFWWREMRKAWWWITHHPQVKQAINLWQIGICIMKGS